MLLKDRIAIIEDLTSKLEHHVSMLKDESAKVVKELKEAAQPDLPFPEEE